MTKKPVKRFVFPDSFDDEGVEQLVKLLDQKVRKVTAE